MHHLVDDNTFLYRTISLTRAISQTRLLWKCSFGFGVIVRLFRNPHERRQGNFLCHVFFPLIRGRPLECKYVTTQPPTNIMCSVETSFFCHPSPPTTTACINRHTNSPPLCHHLYTLSNLEEYVQQYIHIDRWQSTTSFLQHANVTHNVRCLQAVTPYKSRTHQSWKRSERTLFSLIGSSIGTEKAKTVYQAAATDCTSNK